MLRSPLALALAGSLGVPATAQIFVRNATDVPTSTSIGRYTENVDFGDVDLDGDFDAALARGGDFGNLQDRLWINLGGAQGGTLGVFEDRTATQLPVLARDGRDVELVDFDGDADLDLYVANTSTQSNQACLWWTNQGGAQGGALGFYLDETAARWVGLGGPGSSVAPSQILPSGGFVDWSGDGDFGDLDNDGDLDLVHASYGGSFSGTVPTRLFLNDGTGHFSEFNPSGFQVPGSALPVGSPGLWCEGVYQPSTSDSSGAECDIALSATDIDVGDLDGDFDLDILHGDLLGEPRVFSNRLEEGGGAALAFRDVTTSALPSGWSLGSGHYEQELGDFDADGDLDVYGLNWIADFGGLGLQDLLFRNDGAGQFSLAQTIPSGTDGTETDFGDYDNDGDLDVLVAAFSGGDRLYQNADGLGAMQLVDPLVTGLGAHGLSSYIAADADWCDVDGDGDYDYFVGLDVNNPVVYWENQTQVADTTAPRVGPVEVLLDAPAGIRGSPDRAVRAHVYDNAAYYVTWYAPTSVVVELGALELARFPAQSSGGQVFRAELPSNLLGEVTYRFEARDRYGNLGASAPVTYTASTALANEAPYGTPQLDESGLEHEVRSAALLTAGKPWYAVVDTNGLQKFYALGISLAPVAPTADPLLGVVNIDASQAVFLGLGSTNAAGLGRTSFYVASDVSGVGSIFMQAFVTKSDFSGFDSTRGVEVFFHE